MEKTFDLDNLDKSVNLKDDFNLYVNGNWMKKNPVPPKYSKWGTFEILHEENLNRLHNIIKESDCDYKKLKQLYLEFMNVEKLENLDSYVIDKYIKKVKVCQTKSELWSLLGDFYKKGIFALFHFYPSEDAKNSTKVVPYLNTGGLGLPDRDYYFDDDKKEIREKYLEYLESTWKLYKMENKNMEHVLDIETKLAKVTYTVVEKRDPHRLYNKMTISELKEICNLNWDKYFAKLIIRELPYIIVDNKTFYKEFYNLWSTIDLNHWKDLIIVKIISNFSNLMSNRFFENKFNFYSKDLSGQKEPKPRWERAIGIVNGSLGELLGKIYVDKYFPSSSKEKMNEMVNHLQIELKKRIENLDWMSEETKIKALEKHQVFRAKIGYPDKWRDFSSLKFSSKDNLVEMIIKSNIFDFEYEMNRLYKPSDKDRWEMDPHTINAYFHPLKNEIVFPAGILQKPFFDPEADDAVNFGGIGTIIGHEMTHSYDDQGSQFDKNGNLNNWWTKESKAKFSKKAKYYVDEYSKFSVNGKNINGELTLGENLADHGGVKISYYALKNKLGNNDKFKISGFSQYERFFMSWANIWKTNITEEEADRRIMTDPHSPNEWRVNGTLANIPEFHKIFNLNNGDKLYRKNPVQMW